MGYSRALSVSLAGVVGHPVTVEAHIGSGPSTLSLSGLPDTALNQSTVRIRSAFANCELDFPDSHISVNLLPAWLPKAGSACDLAIATAIAVADGLVPGDRLDHTVLFGELGLDGRLRPVRGVLPALMAAGDTGIKHAVVSLDNLAEAALVPGITVRGAGTLAQVAAWLRGQTELDHPPKPADQAPPPPPDLADVMGQDSARRALEVAAAGRHHMFLLGPPGAGKTMLAERLPGLLPELTDAAALSTTALHSLAGMFTDATPGLVRHPPFAAPHHSATVPAMVGGGSHVLRPGAVSLAHNGVLFLDEAPEFRREVLDALRQPLEREEIVIARARLSARFPARIQMVMAANPCPCAAAAPDACTCSPSTRRRYLSRLSGPLLDRIDIHLQLAPVPTAALLADDGSGESSAAIAARVATARAAAAERWSGAGRPWQTNGEVPGPALRASPWRLPRHVTKSADWMIDAGLLTGRSYDRVLRISWSLADLAGRDRPDPGDVNEATALRLGHNHA